MKRVFFSLPLLALAISSHGAPAATQNIHQAARSCRLDFKSGCDNVCLVCHTPAADAGKIYPTPWDKSGERPEEEYSARAVGNGQETPSRTLEGDIQICISCHDTYLTRKGSHPVGIEYDTRAIRAALVENPEGPRIFCRKRGSGCLVLCSSCHDPHEGSLRMMRMDNRRSALCIACHNK